MLERAFLRPRRRLLRGAGFFCAAGRLSLHAAELELRATSRRHATEAPSIVVAMEEGESEEGESIASAKTTRR